MSWKRERIKERKKLIINGRLFMATKNLPYITAAVTAKSDTEGDRKLKRKSQWIAS